jgi:WhiB family redox-sensing transcriptional regulator
VNSSEPTSDTWQQRAACIGEPPELWFPPSGRGEKLDYSLAQRICDRCPVQPECLEHALIHGERHGMWGGRTEHQRHKIRRRRPTRRPCARCGRLVTMTATAARYCDDCRTPARTESQRRYIGGVSDWPPTVTVRRSTTNQEPQ